MEWTFKGEPCLAVPEGKIGFVYRTQYTDGSWYVGKKLAVSMRLLPAISKPRPGSRRTRKLVLRNESNRIVLGARFKMAAKRRGCVEKYEPYDEVWTEHKWRTYEGSSKIKDSYILESKEILGWCNTERAMTYIETDIQFRMGALFDEKCLNLNILGKFYPNVLDGEIDDKD